MTLASTKRIGALALAATVFVAACGGSAATSAPASGAPAGGGASGEIFVSGSSTVEPISTGVAEAFAAANPDFKYTVEGPGTGDGFKKFCAGETDISDASRKIKDEEAKACADAGIEYVELKVAIDGMSVLTSVNNKAVACLSLADLYALIGPESTGFAKWSDAAALGKELGSDTVFPDADLKITGPGEESGTFDSFVELAIAKTAEKRGQEPNTRPDYTASPNDNAIIAGIAGSDTSLGWVGFAFAEENRDKVTEIAGLQGRRTGRASPRRRRPSPTAPTRSPAISTSTSTRRRRPRTRPLPPTSTTTSPTGRSMPSLRPSPMSASRPTRSPRPGRPGTRRSSHALLLRERAGVMRRPARSFTYPPLRCSDHTGAVTR